MLQRQTQKTELYQGLHKNADKLHKSILKLKEPALHYYFIVLSPELHHSSVV